MHALCCLPLLLAMGCDHEAPDTWISPYAKDDVLRVGQGQFVGTHNSTHLRPELLLSEEWDYSHAPLTEQFDRQGVRQIELDVHAEEQGFGVYHIPGVDQESTCPTLRLCLELVKLWSDAHPGHHPILVLIEPKDDIDPEPLDDHLFELDAEILDVLTPARLIQPDDLQGDAPTLREAVWNIGWPLLGEARGKFIFGLLDHGRHRAIYTEEGSTLAGRVMFAPGESLEDPLNALMILDNALSNFDLIQEATAAGILVRTYADGSVEETSANDRTRPDASLASGAQFLSTNWPVPLKGQDYHLSIPEGTPGRCNPISAPVDCRAEDIEDPALLDGR